MKQAVSRALLLAWVGLLLACTSIPSGQSPEYPASRDVIGGIGQPVTLARQDDQRHDMDGIGGTGRSVEDGIGGTGRSLEDGIGGTGIIGSITGFGSIWIHNAHVFIDTAQITANGEKARREDLRLGQIVAVLSDRKGDGYAARSIDIVYEVIAPVASIDLTQHRITALKQSIRYDARTIFSDAKGTAQTTSIYPSQWIKVSGLRQLNGEILASRIDLIDAREEVQLIGEMKDRLVAKYPIKISDQIDVKAQSGRMLVTGKVENGVLVVNKMGQDAISTVVKQASEVLFEGFLLDPTADSDILEGSIDLVLPYENAYFIHDSLVDDTSYFSGDGDFEIYFDEATESMEYLGPDNIFFDDEGLDGVPEIDLDPVY